MRVSSFIFQSRIALLITAFYIDFSFVSSFLGTKMSWPYFTFAFILLFFISRTTSRDNFLWGVLAALFLNTLIPLSSILHILIILAIWGGVYLLRLMFFDDDTNLTKVNIIFVIFYIGFNLLFFILYNINAKFSDNIFLSIKDLQPGIVFIKFLIGFSVYNVCYKFLKVTQLWEGQNTKVLR